MAREDYEYKTELAATEGLINKNKALFSSQLNAIRQIKEVSGEITQEFEEQLDIGKDLAENEKNIFKHRVNVKALATKLKKAIQE